MLYFSDQFLFHYFIISYISKKGIPPDFVIRDLHELWKDNGESCDVESSDSYTQSFESKDDKDELVVPKENFVGKVKNVVKMDTDSSSFRNKNKIITINNLWSIIYCFTAFPKDLGRFPILFSRVGKGGEKGLRVTRKRSMIQQQDENDVQRNARNVKRLTKWLSTGQKKATRETTQQNHMQHYLRTTRGDRSGLRVTRGNKLGLRLIGNGAVGQRITKKDSPDHIAEAEFEKRSGNKLGPRETVEDLDMNQDYYLRILDTLKIPSDYL